MAAKDRPPSFQFYPRDFISDPAVQTMTVEQQGAYFRLLCFAWLQPRQGWLRDDDAQLSLLSGLNGTWTQNRPSIERAFVVRKGWWIQRRMVRERKKQKNRRFQAQKGASVTNAARWGSVAQRQSERRPSVSPAFASAFAVGEEESKPTPCPSGDGRQEGLEGIGEESLHEWSKGFDLFWKEYPRKVARIEAFNAYRKLKPRTQETYDLLFAGLEAWKRIWSKREPDKIEHAATWLNNRRYEDAQTS